MTRDPTEALEPFRKYLEVLASLHLDRRLRGKLDDGPPEAAEGAAEHAECRTRRRGWPRLADGVCFRR
jgi:hypothetical protein